MAGNSSNPMATGVPVSPGTAPFTGAANQLVGSAGLVMAAVAAALVL